MSSVTWQPQPKRRPVPAGPSEEMQEIFDRGLNVADTIEALDPYEWSAADLQWIASNKKGKLRSWAKQAIRAMGDPSN